MKPEAQGAGRKAQGNCETGETSETGSEVRDKTSEVRGIADL